MVPSSGRKDIAAKTLEVLKKYGYTGKQDNVYLQCFDVAELKRIKNELEPKMGMDLNLVQLIAYTDWNETQQKQPDGRWVNYNYDWMFKPGAMKQVAEYADGIGQIPYAGRGRLNEREYQADWNGARRASE